MDSTQPRIVVRMTPEARREQILREATTLIAQSGFNALSLAQVAEACGLRKSSVLHYFPTMADLLRDVLARRDEVVFRDAVDSRLPDPTPQGVRAACTAVAQHHWRQPELTRLARVVSAEALDPGHPAHGWMLTTHRAALQALTAALVWKPQPALAAVELLSFWEGLETVWQRDPAVDVSAVWEQFCDRFFTLSGEASAP